MTDQADVPSPHRDDSTKDISDEDFSPADLLELKIKLLDEVKLLKVTRLAAGLDENTNNITEIQESVSELKDQLLEESNTVSLEELILKRFQLHSILQDVLFKENKDLRDSKITQKCLDELPIASEIMRVIQEIEALQQDNDKLKSENFKLKNENISLMEELKDHQGKTRSVLSKLSKNKDYKMLNAEYDTRCKSLDILKNVIPLLIVGVGKTDDPHLQELILECGQSLNT